MLLYVIPFILLLVVAVVLKKREDANKESSSSAKKTNNKKSSKKNVARTARTSQRQQNTVVEDPIATQQESKPLTPELKQSIEKLIHEKNYFSAEAKINQALNQDNSQHELYLYLLDVHLAQKDEFAVNQLINHIRSLGLDDIVAQAEEHQQAAKVESPVESIPFVSSTTATIQETKDTTAFDALIGTTEPTSEPVKPVTESNQVEHNELEFSSPTKTNETTKETHQESIQPLEFTLTPSTPESIHAPTLEFSDNTVQETVETKTETVAPLEFSFTPNEPTATVEKPAEIAPEFKLDFAEPSQPSIAEEVKPSHDVEFKLTPSETETQPSFSFELDTKPEIVEPDVAVIAPTLSFEASSPIATEAVDSNDPLVQSFPELANTNEAQLNLDLAQQYISLGAYASARELLKQDESSYTPEQHQQSQNLLNQIAS